MPRYQFDSDSDTYDSQNDTWVDSGSRWLNLTVRMTGLILLVVGFVVILMVIGNAWSLYDDPSGIEPLAREIERGSNLDLTLSERPLKRPMPPTIAGSSEKRRSPHSSSKSSISSRR